MKREPRNGGWPHCGNRICLQHNAAGTAQMRRLRLLGNGLKIQAETPTGRTRECRSERTFASRAAVRTLGWRGLEPAAGASPSVA